MYKDISLNVSVSEFCSLGCSHCFLGNERGKKNLIDFGLLDNLFVSLSKSFERIQINWGGGELSLLGKDIFRKIVNTYAFKDKKFYNKLYSMLVPHLDKEWLELVHKFDSIQISIDSYRKRNFYTQEYLGKIRSLNLTKSISYTPHKEDSKEFLRYCFEVAKGIDASVFHLGVLYTNKPEEIVPASKMIELFYLALELSEEYEIELGFWGGEVEGFYYLDENVGWSAFNCFNNGFYIRSDGSMSSCTIIEEYAQAFIRPQSIDMTFLSNADYHKIKGVNMDFINTVFLKPHPDCLECNYYPLCKGGCPFFRYLGRGKDIYCFYYRVILDTLLKRERRRLLPSPSIGSENKAHLQS